MYCHNVPNITYRHAAIDSKGSQNQTSLFASRQVFIIDNVDSEVE